MFCRKKSVTHNSSGNRRADQHSFIHDFNITDVSSLENWIFPIGNFGIFFLSNTGRFESQHQVLLFLSKFWLLSTILLIDLGEALFTIFFAPCHDWAILA
jgi:hypothetical protein